MSLTPREHAEERARTLRQYLVCAADLARHGIDHSAVDASIREARQDLLRALLAMPRLSGRRVTVEGVRYRVGRRGQLVTEDARPRPHPPEEPVKGPHRGSSTVQHVTTGSNRARRPHEGRYRR